MTLAQKISNLKKKGFFVQWKSRYWVGAQKRYATVVLMNHVDGTTVRLVSSK